MCNIRHIMPISHTLDDIKWPLYVCETDNATVFWAFGDFTLQVFSKLLVMIHGK